MQLAALSIQGDHGSDRFIQSIAGSLHFVVYCLVEEVLEHQPEVVQSFLLHTSILDRLSGPLCDAILLDSEISGSERLLDLELQNLFVKPLDNERTWYRYHQLFVESLRRRLKDHQGCTRIAEVNQRASVWYENQGLEIEAFRHAADAGDIERAARLLEGGGTPLHLRGAARHFTEMVGVIVCY